MQPVVDGFVEGMTEQGYLEDETVRYVYFDALQPDMDDDSLAEVAATLNDADVDLFLVLFDWEAKLLDDLLDHDVPIVVCFSEDLVGVGLAESLVEPGGNVTGIQNANYHARGLQLLLEIDPEIEQVYYPYNEEGRVSLTTLEALQEIADILEIELVADGVTDVAEVLQAIREMPDDIDAIYVPGDAMMLQPQVMLALIQASLRLKAGVVIPAAVPVPGILMGYGPDTFANGQQAAGIVDRIFRGAVPGEMPVEISEYFLMVNLQTAENLGLAVPRSILRQAETIVRPGDSVDIGVPDDAPDNDTEGEADEDG
jgi:putative ABC transport system substrate-binding protein